jgi:hypothetical protein
VNRTSDAAAGKQILDLADRDDRLRAAIWNTLSADV